MILTSCASLFGGPQKDFIYEDSIFDGVRKSIISAVEPSGETLLPVISKLHIYNVCKPSGAIPVMVLDKAVSPEDNYEGRILARYKCVANANSDEAQKYTRFIATHCSEELKAVHSEINRLCKVATEV